MFVFVLSSADYSEPIDKEDSKTEELKEAKIDDNISKEAEDNAVLEIQNQLTEIYNQTLSQNNIENITITYVRDGKTAAISEDVTTLTITSQDAVQIGLGVFVAMCTEYFKIDTIDSCMYIQELTYTDSKGQKKDGTPLGFLVNRQKWQEYNWDNLKFKPVIDTLIKDGILYLESSWDLAVKRDGFEDSYIPIPR